MYDENARTSPFIGIHSMPASLPIRSSADMPTATYLTLSSERKPQNVLDCLILLARVIELTGIRFQLKMEFPTNHFDCYHALAVSTGHAIIRRSKAIFCFSTSIVDRVTIQWLRKENQYFVMQQPLHRR